MDAGTVLLVDADEANRVFLGQLLLKKNYQVKHASSGDEALRLFTQVKPVLLIFDSALPDMKAMELVERLQHLPGIDNAPCVVLSSRSDADEMQACLEAGCAEYYVKSGSVMMTLVDSIPRLLKEGKRLGKKAQKGFLYVFLSGKGGTGTSSLCANIAVTMANLLPQSRIAVADLVLPMGSIAALIGSEEKAFNLVTVASREISEITPPYLKDNLLVPAHWNFHFLPGAPDPETAINLNVGHIPNIVESLRGAYDHVLVDLGRSLSRISLPIIQAADLVVAILSTDLSTVNHTKKLWHYLKGQGMTADHMFPILNRAVGLEGLTKAEAEKILELEIKMTMPYMMGNFTLANNQNTPISAKFPLDTATLMLKQAAQDMTRKTAGKRG
jgi:pilus assembly protein CpaE